MSLSETPGVITAGVTPTPTSPVRDDWLSVKAAATAYVCYEARYKARYGSDRDCRLAWHAAFPLFLSTDLINLIHANFLGGEGIPWHAEADFLLSPLCQSIGDGLYRVDPVVREVLLVELVQHMERPAWRLLRLADFLLAYAERYPTPAGRPEVAQAHRWIAAAYLRPAWTVSDMRQTLGETALYIGTSAELFAQTQQLQVALLSEVLHAPLAAGLPAPAYADVLEASNVLARYWYHGMAAVAKDLTGTGTDSSLKARVVQAIRQAEAEQVTAGLGTRAEEPGAVPARQAMQGHPVAVLPSEPDLRQPSAGVTDEDRQGLAILRRKVRQSWIDSVLEKSLSPASLIELDMEWMPGAVDDPSGGPAKHVGVFDQPLARVQNITDVFEKAGGSLLILGEPGSGKTTTLLVLARHLLDRADADPTQPVPAVFNLSSWTAPNTTLDAWLIDELRGRYLVPKKIGQNWLDKGLVLPMLDGLDEVAVERRAECITAIKRFAEVGSTGSVVCCRLQEYSGLPGRLSLNAAVRLLPLNDEQVARYLAAAVGQRSELQSLLAQDPVLHSEARSPLMLNLLIQAYQAMSPEQIAREGVAGTIAQLKKLMHAYGADMALRAAKGQATKRDGAVTRPGEEAPAEASAEVLTPTLFYRNFDLDVFNYEAIGERSRFRVRVAGSFVGEQRLSEAEQVTLSSDLKQQLRMLEQRMLGTSELIAFGETLAAALFPPRVRSFVDRSRARLNDNDGLRIRLRFDTNALADLPWEYIYLAHPDVPADRKDLDGFLALDRRISLVRYEAASPPPVTRLPIPADRLRLAALLSTPSTGDLSVLQLGVEPNIERALRDIPEIDAKIFTNATAETLKQALIQKPQIFHFIGPGVFEMSVGAGRGQGYLVLEDDTKQSVLLPAERLGLDLSAQGVRLAVLDTCMGGRREGANAITGIAPALLRAGIRAVLGTQYTIRDENAIAFNRSFYRALAAGQPIDAAVSDGRLAIFNRGNLDDRDWGVPVLYLDPWEENLFPDLAAPSAAGTARADSHGQAGWN